MTDIPARMRQIVGTSADWGAHDLVLGAGEVALERYGTGQVRARIGDGSTAFSGCPTLGGALDLAAADARYVQEAETFVVGGGAVANKWPRLDATGKIDPSMVTIPTVLKYKGVIDATQAPPAGTATGDLYVNNTEGAVNAAWGAPAAGQTINPGDWLILNNTGLWQVVPMTAGIVSEAPADGFTYGRQNGAWTDAYTVASVNAAGDIACGQNLFMGNGVATGNVSVEVGSGRTGDGLALVDLHASPGTDYNARLIRYPGLNGDYDLVNSGTGGLNLVQAAAAPINFVINAITRAQITPAGDLGVGRVPTVAGLDVYKGAATCYVRAANDLTTVDMIAGSDGTAYLMNGAATSLVLGTAGAARVNIHGDGNVAIPGSLGIATATPKDVLDVNGNINLATGHTIYTGFDATGTWTGQTLAGINFEGAGHINFYTMNTYRGQFTEDGTLYLNGPVGVGIKPTVHLQGYSPGTNSVICRVGNGTSNIDMRADNNQTLLMSTTAVPLCIGTNNATQIYTTAAGTVKINALDPVNTITGGSLTVRANPNGGKYALWCTDWDATQYQPAGFCFAGATVGQIISNAGSTAYATTSDERLKTNIAEADDAGAILDAIRVRKFDWRANGDHVPFGFVAQELIGPCPYAAFAPPEPTGEASEEWDERLADVWMTDNAKLVPLLVKEIQALRARVAVLERPAEEVKP